jgi:hypothetical protein
MSRAFGYQSDKIAMLSTKLRLCPSSKYRAEHRTPMPHGDFHLGKIGAAPSNVPSASAVASLPDMPPLKLTDAELDAVFNAARPLAPNVRENFLKEVADRLSSYAVVGPGTVHRVCLETQRRFFDPPDLGRPGVSAKYR